MLQILIVKSTFTMRFTSENTKHLCYFYHETSLRKLPTLRWWRREMSAVFPVAPDRNNFHFTLQYSNTKFKTENKDF